MQQRALLQQSHRPARTGGRDRSQLPDPRGKALSLGVDHTGRRLLPEAVAGLLRCRQAAAQQVRQALLQLHRACRDPLGPPLRPAPRGLRISGPGRRSRVLSRTLLLRALAPPRQPLPGPFRCLPRRHRSVAARPEQQQPESVLARELAARTTALVRGPGGVRDVDDRLIRLASAALAQPPHRPLVGTPRLGPRPRRAEFASRFA